MTVENMNINYKHFANHQQYDDINVFIKVHESVCKGTFTTSLNRKNTTTHQKTCKACGSVAYTQIGEYRNNTKIFFKGFIRYDKIGLERPQTQYGNKKFNNHCVACGEHFKLNTSADYCPTCNAGHYEESYTNYDSHAESHATSTDNTVWQQGQQQEVNADVVYTNGKRAASLRKQINNLKNNNGIYGYKRFLEIDKRDCLSICRKTVRMSAIIQEEDENDKKLKCDYVRNNIIPAEKAEKRERLRAHGFYAMCDNLIMADLEKQIKTNPCMTYRLRKEYATIIKRTPRRTEKKQSTQGTFKDVPLMLYECAISNAYKTPEDAEVIEVTRAKKHILSPSWNVLNQYKKDKDQIKYIGAFMQEMTTPKAKSAMLDIIEKAKDHPVYLTCFEVTGFCHRFLLMDWIKRLETV